MSNLKGIAYMRQKMDEKAARVKTRYTFYDMKNIARDLVMVDNIEFRTFRHVLGWCPKAVDSVADRLCFRGFDNDIFDFWQIFSMNNPDVLFDSAILSALISSCSFVYISKDKEGFPRLQVIDGASATGIINPITGLLQEGYAILERDENGNPIVEAYFTPTATHIFRKGISRSEVIHNRTGHPLLVPIIHRPDAKRPFGRSRITRSGMDCVSAAMRTLKRTEVASEFYSFPQKYITGLSQDAEMPNKWKAAMSAFISLTKDDDGDAPKLGQFQQQSIQPFIDEMRMHASVFAGDHGLTLDDMGFPSDNPSSSEAIKASHENLRLVARKAQRTFGSGFLNVGYVSACVRDDYSYKREQIYMTKPLWEPIFEPDFAALSSIGDGAIKLNQAVPGFVDNNMLRNITGFGGQSE